MTKRIKKKSKAAPEKVEHAEAVRNALSLRRSGASYEEIGKATGVCASTAWKRVQAGFRKLEKLNAQEAEYVRDLELSRLDFYLRSLDKRIRKGEPAAISAAQRISESRRKLLGVDAPEQIEHTDIAEMCELAQGGDENAMKRLQGIIAAGAGK